jgi:hypothetical protein
MRDQNCLPYRGLGVHVRITEHESVSFNGSESRYSATWYLHKEGPFVPANVIASFTEPMDFACPEEAASFAERRAHTFADCTFTAREQDRPDEAAAGPKPASAQRIAGA